MSLHDPERFQAAVGALPAVTFIDQWESRVAKVGGKVFTLLGLGSEPDVVFKVSELSFEGLTSQPGIRQAPYFAKRKWVSVSPGALPEAELLAYIGNSHRTVAAALTRKAQAELGLTAYLATGPAYGLTA